MQSDCVKAITITCDHWSDFAMKHNYLGVTAQFLIIGGTLSGKLVHVLLALREVNGQTGSMLFNDYMEAISFYGIEKKINFVITDGASHNKTAFGAADNNARLIQALCEIHDLHYEDQEDDFFDKELADGNDNDVDDGIPVIPAPEKVFGSRMGRIWHYCTAHLIQAAIRWAYTNGASKYLTELLKNCQLVVASIRRRHAAHLLGIHLKTPTDIRWDSRIMMAESIIKNKDKLRAMADKMKKDAGDGTSQKDQKARATAERILKITTTQALDLLKEFKKVLEAVRDIRLSVSSDSYPTFPMVAATKLRLRKFLNDYNNSEEQHTDVTGFTKMLLKRLEEKFELEKWHAAAAILFPLYSKAKTREFLNFKAKSTDEQTLYEMGYELISDLYDNIKAERQVSGGESAAGTSNAVETAVDDELDFMPQTSTSQDTVNEIDRYLNLLGSVPKERVCEWLAETYKSCPIMVEVAVMFMIPATSVKAESIFSQAGHRLGKRNQQMSPETLEVLLWRIANDRYITEKVIHVKNDWDDDSDAEEEEELDMMDTS